MGAQVVNKQSFLEAAYWTGKRCSWLHPTQLPFPALLFSISLSNTSSMTTILT
jgi:hypothetical protein